MVRRGHKRARRSAAVAIAALMIATPGGNLPVAAGAEVANVAFDGDSAAAVFESADGCVTYAAQVRASEGVSRDSGTRPAADSSVLIHLTRSDTCGDTVDSRIGRVALSPDAFQVHGDLGSASLHLRGGFRDWLTGQTVPLDLDLTWRAAGDRVRSSHHQRSLNPDGSMWITRIWSTQRAAVASGRIWDGAYDYAGAGESTSAGLGSNRQGFVTVASDAGER